MANAISTRKPQKSVKLTDDEIEKLVELRNDSITNTSFAYKFRMDRVTLSRIIKNGYGSELNIKKIRRTLVKIN